LIGTSFDISKKTLLYRATRDGFTSANFHLKCNSKSNTLTIVQTTLGYVFGGYTTAIWSSSSTYKTDTNAFLFSLINKENHPYKSAVKSTGSNAIYDSASYGPTFGNGHDLYIADNSDSNTNSISNWGHSYSSMYLQGSAQAQSFFAGSSMKEIEVFQI
jgi:hypothetical protein